VANEVPGHEETWAADVARRRATITEVVAAAEDAITSATTGQPSAEVLALVEATRAMRDATLVLDRRLEQVEDQLASEHTARRRAERRAFILGVATVVVGLLGVIATLVG
jgi:hypothetical protein